MLDVNSPKCLKELLTTSECNLVVPREWEALLTQQGVIPTTPNDHRKYLRYHFNRWAVLERDQTSLTEPTKHTISKVVTRNVSRSGVAFIHSESLPLGERVSLWLSIGKHSCVVVRCVEHNDNCFEIGLKLADKVPDAGLNPDEMPVVNRQLSDMTPQT